MDENSAAALFITVIMVLLAIVSVVLFLLSPAKFRGWEEGRQENECCHRRTTDILRGRIEAMEHALAMYRDIATTFCDNTSDCVYCPYERDKNDSKCALWELDDAVINLDIAKVHVRTKHDGGDGN